MADIDTSSSTLNTNTSSSATTLPLSPNNMNNTTTNTFMYTQISKPTMLWIIYDFCSYFIPTVLIPLVLPILITGTVSLPTNSEKLLNESLIQSTIHLGGAVKICPLLFTSISWILGLCFLAAILHVLPIHHLDRVQNQQRLARVATVIGAVVCILTGVFRNPWIVFVYIALIVIAITIVGGAHARHLGRMVLEFTGSNIPQDRFPTRTAFGCWLSLTSTAAGCSGAAIMAVFTYLMLRRLDPFTSLWVVSIFSGLLWWAVGRIWTNEEIVTNETHMFHVSVYRYKHVVGSVCLVFLSELGAMGVFGGGLLHAMSPYCVRADNILLAWIVYFLSPAIILPLIHPLLLKLKRRLDVAEKMLGVGFVLLIVTSVVGIVFRQSIWSKSHMLLFAAIQGTATGWMRAFGRVLFLDCSPAGREGAYSVWFSWFRSLGTCAGFALATALPRNIGTTFAVSCCAGGCGFLVLFFGNISSFRGAKAAGHVHEELQNVADNHENVQPDAQV